MPQQTYSKTITAGFTDYISYWTPKRECHQIHLKPYSYL